MQSYKEHIENIDKFLLHQLISVKFIHASQSFLFENHVTQKNKNIFYATDHFQIIKQTGTSKTFTIQSEILKASMLYTGRCNILK